MSTYLFINVCILLVPTIAFVFSKQKKAWLKERILPLLVIGIPFIYWDHLVTKIGHWAFNQSHIAGVKIVGLPLEEVFFFISVPLAMLTIYDLIQTNRSVSHSISKALISVIAVLSSFLLYTSRANTYTSIVSTVSLGILAWLVIDKKHMNTHKFWLFHAWGLILFILTNTLLTGIPIVTYGSDFITNIRIGTIPIEDFFYNFSMLTGYILVYDYAKKR